MADPTRRSGGGPRTPASRLTLSRRFLLFTGLIILLIATLTAVDGIALSAKGDKVSTRPYYYLSLGDSVAYGFQPDYNFTAGFSDDLYATLRGSGVTDVVNYACGGESTQTMIHGNCTGKVLKHDIYAGAQLSAAVSFLKRHSGEVSVVTLIIGANDVLGDLDQSTCQVNANVNADITRMDTNLTQTILPELTSALHPDGVLGAARFVMLNYYNPFVKMCPDSTALLHEVDDHLATDAAQFRIPVVDVYAAFGGDAHEADNICGYTWICSAYDDIHPTTRGYQVIANAIENVLGTHDLAPGVQPPPAIATPPTIPSPASS